MQNSQTIQIPFTYDGYEIRFQIQLQTGQLLINADDLQKIGTGKSVVDFLDLPTSKNLINVVEKLGNRSVLHTPLDIENNYFCDYLALDYARLREEGAYAWLLKHLLALHTPGCAKLAESIREQGYQLQDFEFSNRREE